MRARNKGPGAVGRPGDRGIVRRRRRRANGVRGRVTRVLAAPGRGTARPQEFSPHTSVGRISVTGQREDFSSVYSHTQQDVYIMYYI